MLTKIFSFLGLSLLALSNSLGNSEPRLPSNSPDRPSGTLEKMIVASGNVAMELDLTRLEGIGSAPQHRRDSFRFEVRPDSFFTIRVFNKVLRGAEPGSMELVSGRAQILPEPLNASVGRLVVEKVQSGNRFDLLVRDGQTGFVFFNVEGAIYEYDANAHSLGIKGGRLLISQELANKLGHSADAGVVAGEISIAAVMVPIEITTVANGVAQSTILPPRVGGGPGAPEGSAPGPDIIVGDLPSLEQFGAGGSQVGLGLGTTSCNNGNVEVDWFQLPEIDHCVIPQNLYRMSGGPNNDARFEQIGQSWMKHAFFALQDNACGFGCIPAASGEHLGVGCSDPYDASLNADQDFLGSRAWVNPFTGAFPSTSVDHTGHVHTGQSHRIIVEVNDLNTALNPGATYFAEAQYVTPQEYAWCQTHPGQCNMFNNASYRQFSVSGTTDFTFSPIGSTVRMSPAINAWPGATVRTIEPAPGVDGRAFLAFKVTFSSGVWHYEYAIYNQNLDRGIQSLSIPLPTPSSFSAQSNPDGVNQSSNPGFHAPPQHPGFANDGTEGDAGFSDANWTFSGSSDHPSWHSESFAQNPNANAIRWGTLYNFRFDAARPPVSNGTATIGFFKTGAPITVTVDVPEGPHGGPTPTATPTPTPVGPTPTPVPTPCLGFLENFDAVTAPALPAGWVATNTVGPPPLWVTETAEPATPPNDAFVDDPSSVSDKRLDTPEIEIVSTTAQLKFRNSYSFDPVGGGSMHYYDGGVLEISSPNIAGGAFVDITDPAVSGSFVTGGYNGTISTVFSNPLGGRMAWGQNFTGETIVNLGTNVAGQTIKLRFRMCSDSAAAGAGWHIDTITIITGVCAPTPTPTPEVTPTATPTGTTHALNLSTRLFAQAGNDVGIGGFIIVGNSPKQILLRGIGPSLGSLGVSNPLADPVLELHDSTGPTTATNNNWRDTQEAEIIATGIAPSDDLESAILVTLDPGSYTAVLKGNNDGTGVGLVEIYDLSPASDSKLGNLSTRAFVGTGNDIVISGFILGDGSGDDAVSIRGIGPSLTAFGIFNALADPMLQLRDSNGALIAANDNWQDPPFTPPGGGLTNPLESAIDINLMPGAYTALLSGVNGGVGVGLVEVYDRGAP